MDNQFLRREPVDNKKEDDDVDTFTHLQPDIIEDNEDDIEEGEVEQTEEQERQSGSIANMVPTSDGLSTSLNRALIADLVTDMEGRMQAGNFMNDPRSQRPR
jgi:hypothetical protein